MPERTPEEVNRRLAEKVMGWHLESEYWWDAKNVFRRIVSRWYPFSSPNQCILEVVPAIERRG